MFDALQRLLHGGANLGHVPARCHGGAQQHGIAALIAAFGGRRIFQTPADLGDIAEPEGLLANAQSQLADVVDRAQPARHLDPHRALPSLNPARRVHGVLAGECCLDIESRQATLRQGHGRHLDEDALLLQAEQVDLGDAGYAQQNIAGTLGEILELGIAKTVASKGVKRDVGIAEFIIEEGADHAFRQRLADVADLLARLIERILDRLTAHGALEVDKDVGKAGSGVGAQEIEARRLLQLALDLVDHLVLHFLRGGARPNSLHHHDAEGEVWVFLLANAQKRKTTCREQQHEQERGEAAMADGPPRQVERR